MIAILLLLLAAPAAAQQQVQPIPKVGTPADNETNTQPTLPRIGAYTFVFDGAQWDRWTGSVTISGTPSVVNAGTFAVQASQTGIWSTRGQDGSGNALTSAARGSERALSVQIVDGSGNQITSFGGSGGTASNFTSAFPASGTATGWSDGTNMQGPRVFDADSGAGTQYVAGVSLRKIASGGSVEAGTSSDPLRMDPTGTTTQPVNTAQINGVAPLMGNGPTGTGSARVTVATDNSAVASWGQGATGSSVPANAQYQGARGTTALPTAVSDGQQVGSMSDKFGRLISVIGAPRDLVACETTTISASTSETTVGTAGGANVFIDPFLIIVSNTSTATNTRIDVRDATAGTIRFSLESFGGQNPTGFNTGGIALPQTTANNNWTMQAATSTTDLRVYFCYIKNK